MPVRAERAPQLRRTQARLHDGCRTAACCTGMERAGLGARASRRAWLLQVRLASTARLLFPAS